MYLKFFKRFLDVILSFIFLLGFLPIGFFIGLLILFIDGWPIIVRLDRISAGRVIKVYKFRTMIRGAAQMKEKLKHLNERTDGPFFKIKNDPRLTKLGKFLRKFRLDEFPQLFNVLKGEISLVGPRPHEPEEVAQYPLEFKKLALVKAGLTGLSQVNGASALPFRRELALDLYYIKHQSFWLDLKILFRTFWIFFSDPTGV